MNFLARLLSFVPCRSSRAVDSAWSDGFIAGAISAGITRDRRGRFKSFTPPPPKQRRNAVPLSQLFPSSDV
jgi:hypothetical protein